MKIIFFGTPCYAEKILNDLIDHNIDIVGVVTRPDKPKGRSKKLQPPPVKTCAERRLPGVPIFQPEKASTPEFAQTLNALEPDLFVVVAYGEIIKQFLLDIPKFMCINVHFSLLPRWRGAAPMQRALMAGDKETGVCIIEMVAGMDAGDILGMSKTSISLQMTCGELGDLLCDLSGPLVRQVIDQIARGREERIVQDVSKITMAPKITSEEAQIHWEKDALTLHNHIRALNPAPGAWCQIDIGGQIKRIKILRSIPHAEKRQEYSSAGWFESCGKGSLELLEIQLEGKKPMTAKTFILGCPAVTILK